MTKESQLELAIDVLRHNLKIYHDRLFNEFLSKDRYEDLGHYLYTFDDRVGNAGLYFGVKSGKDWKPIVDVFRRMRARHYMWQEGEEEGRLYGKTAESKDELVIKDLVKNFRTNNKITDRSKIKIGYSVKALSSMFKLNANQQNILQFLFDLEVGLEGRMLRDECFSLFCYYETKGLFKQNLYEILRVFIGKIDKSDVTKLVGLGIVSESEEPYTKSFSSHAETLITPFWPQIQGIYIRLILQNKSLEFNSIISYFRDNFCRKLSYTDFKDLEQTPIVEKLVNKSLDQKSQGVNVLFYGMPGTGKTELVHALAEQNKWKLIILGENEEQEPKDRLADLRFAQQFFKNFKNERIVFMFDEMEDLLNIKRDEMSKAQINRIIENSPFPIFWTTNNVHRFQQSFLRRMTYAQKFDIPNKKRRKEIWNKFSKENNLTLDQETLDMFADNYYAAPSVISNVSDIANKAKLQKKETKIVIEGLLTAYNQGEEPRVTKDPYVGQFVPYDFRLANTDTDLELVMKNLKASQTKNWNMCLNGAPGTGKSAYARHIAKELGLNIIYKRASDLLDMYVGGTEKNIADAFKEADEDGALLVFDEADSFLQSRAGANRSWEITQVNEMLTQMENAKHPFICTTNLIENLDEASLRRFVFKIKFDWMKTEQIQLAFKEFFDMDVDVPAHWRLSPGDFVSVKKRTNILGTVDKDEIFKLLETEFKMKKLDGTKPIGFNK